MRHYELYERVLPIEERELDTATGEFISGAEVNTTTSDYKVAIWTDDAHTHLIDTMCFETLEQALAFIKRNGTNTLPRTGGRV